MKVSIGTQQNSELPSKMADVITTAQTGPAVSYAEQRALAKSGTRERAQMKEGARPHVRMSLQTAALLTLTCEELELVLTTLRPEDLAQVCAMCTALRAMGLSIAIRQCRPNGRTQLDKLVADLNANGMNPCLVLAVRVAYTHAETVRREITELATAGSANLTLAEDLTPFTEAQVYQPNNSRLMSALHDCLPPQALLAMMQGAPGGYRTMVVDTETECPMAHSTMTLRMDANGVGFFRECQGFYAGPPEYKECTQLDGKCHLHVANGEVVLVDPSPNALLFDGDADDFDDKVMEQMEELGEVEYWVRAVPPGLKASTIEFPNYPLPTAFETRVGDILIGFQFMHQGGHTEWLLRPRPSRRAAQLSRGSEPNSEPDSDSDSLPDSLADSLADSDPVSGSEAEIVSDSEPMPDSDACDCVDEPTVEVS